MRKKMLSVVLALCLLLDLAPVARAASVTASGAVGCVSWSLAEDGTLTISGNGAIPDYNKYGEPSPDITARPWQQHRYAVKRLVVQGGVTRIGDRAFQGFAQLESVVLADSVKSIGVWAFQNCYTLGSVQMPDGIAIELGAFRSAPAEARLVSADGMPDGLSWSLSAAGTLTISGSGAIPDYNKSDEASPTINDRPWAKYRNSVRKLVVREGITRVGSRAFQSFEHLESVVLADSVKTIGVWAFQNCFALSEVTLPDSVCLDTGAFRDTPAFELPAPKDSGAASTDAIRVTVNVNGSEVQWTDAVPFIDANGRTMVPLRAVGDALGLSVGWSDEAREASFTDGAKAIYFPIGSTEARAGLMGTVPMETAAVIIDGRTYAPVRYLAEYFGYSVEWDGMSNTVVIKKP